MDTTAFVQKGGDLIQRQPLVQDRESNATELQDQLPFTNITRALAWGRIRIALGRAFVLVRLAM